MDDWFAAHACGQCPWTAIDRDRQDTGAHDPSRHVDFGHRGGFVAPLDLPGWGWQSYWGMSERELGFFAALWHERRWGTVPDYALVSGHRYHKYPGCLTLRIVEITGLNSLKVVPTPAEAAMRALTRRSAGAHRLPIVDYLVAAAAQEIGAAVLHYDRDYVALAEVMTFEAVWLAPPGSLP